MQVRSRAVGATITAESTPAFKPAWQSHWISASRPVVQLTAKRFARIVPGASSHSVLSRRGRDRRSQQCERGRPRASCWGSSGQCSSAARVTLVAVAILRVCPAVAAGPPGLAGEQFQRRPTPVPRTCRAPSLSWPLAGRRIARSASRCPPAWCEVSRTPILTSVTHFSVRWATSSMPGVGNRRVSPDRAQRALRVPRAARPSDAAGTGAKAATT